MFDLFKMLTGVVSPSKRRILVVEKPAFTRNLFGPVEEIAGKKLELLERNDNGDCLCLFTGSKGIHIVDVDNRDVVKQKDDQ